MEDRDSRPSGESQRFEQLFSTTTSGKLDRLTEWELALEDELAGREDAPGAALGMPECLLAVQAILLHRHAEESLDPYFADLVKRTEIPDEAMPALREYTPDELGPRVDTLAAAEVGEVLAVAVLLELKLHNDLVYWAPLLDAGRRGDFTTHLGAFREALVLGQVVEDRLRELGLVANPMVLRLLPLLDDIRAALPTEDTLPPVPPPRATPDAPTPPKQKTPFWTPPRIATWTSLVILMVVGTLISLMQRPVEITDQYTGDEPVEQVIRSGGHVEVVVPAALTRASEEDRLAALERIAEGLPLRRRATVDFSTAEGVPIAERSARGEIRLLPAP